MSLGKKVFSGAVLLFIRKIWGNVINLVVMAFLARILSKEDFGLLAISSVLLSIINTLATSGIAEYIVYYDGDDKKEKINAAFWLNLLLTLGVVGVVVLAGPLWADFYHNEKIYSLLLLLVFSFFFEMGSTVPRSLLRKQLDYKTLVSYGTVSMTLVSFGKLGAAFYGLGVYSLALPQAIVSPLLMTAFFLKTRWRPLTGFGIIHFKSIVNYSKHIIGGRVLTRLVNEGDTLIIGKFVGLEGLGVYSLAFNLANLVTTNVIFIANDIFLPLFSKVKGDVQRLRDIYIKMINALASLSFPVIAALCVSAPSIVNVIYGEKWNEVVLPFQILCLFALGRSISSPSSSLFNAVGRPDISFKFALFFTPVFLVAVYFGSLSGVIGVAIATTVIRVAGSVISLYLSLELIGLSLSDLFVVIRRNFIVSFLCVVLLLAGHHLGMFNGIGLVFLFLIPVIIYLQYLVQRLIFQKDFSAFISGINQFIGSDKISKILYKVFFIKVTT